MWSRAVRRARKRSSAFNQALEAAPTSSTAGSAIIRCVGLTCNRGLRLRLDCGSLGCTFLPACHGRHIIWHP